MEKPTFKLVGSPCGQHGQYTFYKALRLCGAKERIIAIGDFIFVRIWQDSELVSIGELQLLWTDRVSEQTLVSLRLYFLPENTPDGRGAHGEHEVLAINDKVVVRAEDLVSWSCSGESWEWGLRAVWRGACAPPAEAKHSASLHHTNMDFSDIEKEKSTIEIDADSPGVVVFSYPRYCRYRALLSRLEGIQADWLRDSLVAALGGYAAPTKNTRILYCKDTFEYPELEGHEFVCNHLAPRLKGRPRGRRRRPPRSRSHSRDSPERSSDSDLERPQPRIQTPRRLSLRNGDKASEEEDERREDGESGEDGEFLGKLRQFYKDRDPQFRIGATLKDLSLRAIYTAVRTNGGYEAVCRLKLWRTLFPDHPARTRRHYERYLLSFEIYDRKRKLNGKVEPRPVATIDVTSSPPTHHRLRTPSPPLTIDNGTKDELTVISKPAEEYNREFLESLPKDEKAVKISVKPVEKLIEAGVRKLFHEEGKVEEDSKKDEVLNEAQKSNIEHGTPEPSLNRLAAYVNGHAPSEQPPRPAGRSSLRHVRVKPARPPHNAPVAPPRSPSPPAPAPPPITNFGIHHPPQASDDDIVEVPYKPKTPEIIDLDEYPESPQGMKKKKLDILKERGLEVTAVPGAAWPGPAPLAPPLAPLLPSGPVLLNPAMQHQIMTQAQLFQMYNIVPPNFGNGLQPPKVIQATSIFGSVGPEKTVYGNPKDPFMPPPHILHGAPVKQQKVAPTSDSQQTCTRQDILDLTCNKKTPSPTHAPAVEIVRIPTSPSPSKVSSTVQNLAKNYTLIDGKAVVGSNLEITLVNPKAQTPKNKIPQKRSSNGKFVSTKSPLKDYKPYTCPSPSGIQKKPTINVPNYQVRDELSPTNSSSSRDSQQSVQNNMLNIFKNQNSLAQIIEMQKNAVPSINPFMDPVYMSALYSSLGQLDPRQLAAYRDLAALRQPPVNVTPTTKH
ncbi:AT-rich interactive domain-containing protein 5B-like [Plodia interpunctella]|uniref:AT-rich interactive domain-containing protein 5B-like n=1 Tax=Plodia interpunctella TaxID=58824 RepID=UPI0023683C97|nr:AT-rich interactive domain-containing protein 5B-like [Plodia interpunctella]